VTTPNDARRKLEWADRHIADLLAALDEFRNGDRYTISPQKRIEFRESRVIVSTWTLDRMDPLPASWPLEFGDIVHNLRSALDLTIWQVTAPVRPAMTERQHREIAFPIALSAEDFDTSRMMPFLDEPTKDALRAQQPFVHNERKPSRDALWTLSQLSNRDKHRALPIVATVSHEAKVMVKPDLGGGVIEFPTKGALDRGSVVVTFAMPCPLAVEDVRIDLDISFELSAQRAKDHPAVPLHIGVAEMRGRVEAALSALGF
jgi:hypothetical protein